MKKKFHVGYYALLKQERGLAQEIVDSEASTARELFHELKAIYAFKLSESQIKVAINSQASSWDTPLHHNDAILFIPPVAGG